MCTCGGRGGVTALLSDFDLVETATNDGKWARLRDSEPAGTRGMKAPEVCKQVTVSNIITRVHNIRVLLIIIIIQTSYSMKLN